MVLESALAIKAFEIALPYLRKGAEAIAGEAGKEVFKKVKEIFSNKGESELLDIYQNTPTAVTKDRIIEILAQAIVDSPSEKLQLQTIVNDYSQKIQINASGNSTTNVFQNQINIDSTLPGNILSSLKDAVRKLESLQENELEAAALKFRTFPELCQGILPFIVDNNKVFKTFGPNSSANVIESLRTDMTLWKAARFDYIIPNNEAIYRLVTENKQLIPEMYRENFDKLL